MIDEPVFAQAKQQDEFVQTEEQDEAQKTQKKSKKQKEKIDEGEESKNASSNSKTPTDDTKRESYQRFTDTNSLFLSLENSKDCEKVLKYLGEDGQFLNTKLKQPGKILSKEALEDPGEKAREKEKELSLLEWILQFIMALFGGGMGGKAKETLPERVPAMEFVLDATQMRAIDSGQDVEIGLANGAKVYLNKGIMVDKAENRGEGLYACRFGAVCIKEEGSNKFNVLDIASLGREFRDPEKGALLKSMMEKQIKDTAEAAQKAAAEALANPGPETGMAAALAAAKAADAAGTNESLSNPIHMGGEPKKFGEVRVSLDSKLPPPKDHEVQIRMTEEEYDKTKKGKVPFVVVRNGRNETYLLDDDDIHFASQSGENRIATIHSIQDADGNTYKGADLRNLNLDGATFHSLIANLPERDFFLHNNYLNELKKKGETSYTFADGLQHILRAADVLEKGKVEENGQWMKISGYTARDKEGNEERRDGEHPQLLDSLQAKGVEKINDIVSERIDQRKEELAVKKYKAAVNKCAESIDDKITNYIRFSESQSKLSGEFFKAGLLERAVTAVISVKDKEGVTQNFYAEKEPIQGLSNTGDLRSLTTFLKMAQAGEVSADKMSFSYRYTPIEGSGETEKLTWEKMIKDRPNLDTAETKAFYISTFENMEKGFSGFTIPEKPVSLQENDHELTMTKILLRHPPTLPLQSDLDLKSKEEMLQILTTVGDPVYDRLSGKSNPEKTTNAFNGLYDILKLPLDDAQKIFEDGRVTVAEKIEGKYFPVSLNAIGDEIASGNLEKEYMVVPAEHTTSLNTLEFAVKDIVSLQIQLQKNLEDIPINANKIPAEIKEAIAREYYDNIKPQGTPDGADRLILHEQVLAGCMNGIFPVSSEKAIPTEKELASAVEKYAGLFEKRPETDAEMLKKAVASDSFEARLNQGLQTGMEQKKQQNEEPQASAPKARF